MEMKFEKVY